MRALAIFVIVVSLASCTLAPTLEQAKAPPPVAEGPLALRGHVVTPAGVQRDHWILVDKGRIASIGPERPAAARTLETGGYIYPGFVDLHNHPMYNILPRWKPPHGYANRYEWRNDPVYRAAVAPQSAAVAASFCDVDAYAELKMLAAGTTTTVGISKPSGMATMDACIAGLARNLDWHTGFHGAAPGNEPVLNLIGITPGDTRGVNLPEVAAKLAKGELDLLAIHIAEGRGADPQTRGEFALLESSGLLTRRTAVIHGIALTPGDFAKMAAAGAALVWSPRSNMVLYGETADVQAALRAGVRVAIAPDWGPTGSDNLLDELAFAASLSRARMNGAIGNKQLFEMATRIPAQIAGIEREVGSLAPGLRADLFVLKSPVADPYDALVQAGASRIALVLVEGVPVYGDEAALGGLGVAPAEPLAVCGTRKALNPRASPGSFADIAGRIGAVLAAQGTTLSPLVELCR